MDRRQVLDDTSDPSGRQIAAALGLALAFVLATRLPVARSQAFDFDEVGYLEMIRNAAFPMHHTLFLAAGRALGGLVGDPYRGFVVLDMLTSALALVAAWWWLRALVGPRTAAAGALLLGCGPVFWAYGAMAGNYTAIVFVGSTLLGIAWRGRTQPRPWHPFVAAVVLALGTGYRQDIGTFWLPVFVMILWRHRWIAAAQASLLFVALNLAWLAPMLRDAGGWANYRAASAEFAYEAGYKNSVWYLGLIDAPLRYVLKGSMAALWTFGPALLLVPVGVLRAVRRPGGWGLLGWLGLSVCPALASHLLVHFGVPGYAMHYVPALIALVALGLMPRTADAVDGDRRAAYRGLALASVLAAAFLFYPTNYAAPGFRREFDLAFARLTRRGLQLPNPVRDPHLWRTAASQSLPGDDSWHPAGPRNSVADILRQQ